ncbi:MAG: nitrogenase iron-molybdenum cofactor biosynthesis protein NifN, partial [Rhodospirillaceae bacterium]|nr:nitrogenase iron-molybdenum cofactor biosynthesis protein NifN [Rhodospirillaceae bacterium]
MASISPAKSPLSVNPLKVSAPLGAALAYLGVEGSVPLFHGSQGCTAFALVHLVRHFKESIPLQTTAMNEVSTILGGADHVEEAIENLRGRANPKFIGICSTALTETRGEDIAGELRDIRARRADFADTEIVFAATPDFDGGLETGWAKAVKAIVETMVPDAGPGARVVEPGRVNVLAGAHLTPADVEELTRIVEAFGLVPTVLPDLSGSLDGHVVEGWVTTSLGGTRLDAIRTMGRAVHTLAIGESLRPAAAALEARTGVPFTLFQSVCGLKAVDAFVRTLMELTGR